MKVLRVIARLNIGGPARHVVLLNHGLQARGYETLLVHGSVDSGEASLEHLALESGLRVHKIRELGRNVNVLTDLRALARLVRLIAEESPDVVHTHTAKAGTLGRLAATLVNLRRPRSQRSVVIHTYHGHVLAGYFSPAVNLVIRFVERMLAAASDRIVVISSTQRDDIVGRYGIARASRTEVIPLGLDLEPLLELSSIGVNLRRELGIGESDTVVGFVGRFVPIKDPAALLRAFGVAVSRSPNMWLVLFGGGPLRADLEELADRLGVGSRVRFYGWTERLAEAYRTLDICAISSLNEGTPVAVIEAMAAGKAVVATAVGGVLDLVDSERTGVLVKPGDVKALADALVRLAENPSDRLRMGRAARQFVATRFSRARLVEDINGLYVRALAEKRPLAKPPAASSDTRLTPASN